MSDTRTIRSTIKGSRTQVWNTLFDGSKTPAYYFGFGFEGDLEDGAEYRYVVGGQPVITGQVTELTEGEHISMTFNPAWDDALIGTPESVVTYRLSEAEDAHGVVMLDLTHEGVSGDIADNLERGWVLILSGLKTLIETGAPMRERHPA